MAYPVPTLEGLGGAVPRAWALSGQRAECALPYTESVGGDRMPARAIGSIPLGVGALGLLATVETSSGTEYSWIDWAFGPALIGIGLGLLFSQRWGVGSGPSIAWRSCTPRT
jgi:hypothetical protein